MPIDFVFLLIFDSELDVYVFKNIIAAQGCGTLFTKVDESLRIVSFVLTGENHPGR
jgi:hypothetical protein